MSEFRAIVFDLDGTAIPEGAQSVDSPRLIKAVKSLPEDIVAMAATARVRDHALPIARQLGLRHSLITTDGAVTVNAHSGEVIRDHMLSPEQVARILGLLGLCNSLEYQFALDGDPLDKVIYAHQQVARACAGAYLLGVPLEVATAVQNSAAELLPEVNAYISTTWGGDQNVCDVNMCHISAGKGNALREAAKDYDLDTGDFIAVGNGVNDMPLFRVAGFGIAVADAHPKLLEIADEIAPSQANDGLSYIIEKYFIEN